MENKAKILETSLSSLLSDQSKIKELSNYGLLAEYKRLYLAVKYINQNSIVPVNGRALDALTNAIGHAEISSADFKLATSCAELAILDGLKAAGSSLDSFAIETKKDAKTVAKKKKELVSVAGEILPDALNRVYDILQDYGRNGQIFNADGNVVFDFDVFIEKINKSAHTTSVINNLPSLSVDATEKYRRIVKESAKEFLHLIPEIGRTLSAVVDAGPIRQTVVVNTDVRKLRRANRPKDKNGNLLPSYVDYITDTGAIVPYYHFQSTPTGRLLKEFRNEEEYANYVSSTAFWAYVSYLETPMSAEAVEVGLPSFGLNELSEHDGVDPFDTRRFAKEKLILPKNVYKSAKKSGNATTTITKLRDENIINTANRVIAAALSVVVLANSLGWPINQIVNSIKEGQSNDGPGNTPIDPPVDTPVKPPETTTPEDNNVEIVDPDEIIDNPADDVNPPEETTGPEDVLTPPEVTTPPEDNPSQDNSETPLPGHNDVDEDRREESTGDSFWFE